MIEIPYSLWALIGAGIVVSCLVIADAIGRKQESKPKPGSLEDPNVAFMVVKQRAMGKRLRRLRKSLLTGKDYVPELTKKNDAPEPARQFYAIRGGKN